MLLYALLLLIFIFFVVYIAEINSPQYIGKKSEEKVSSILNKLNPAEYLILNNLLIPSDNFIHNTQIDHLIISNYGIFCIETKGIRGWVSGAYNQENWTKQIFRHYQNFYNPIKQNHTHVLALEKILGTNLLKKNIVQFVVFTNAVTLNISGTDNVFMAKDLLNKINQFKNIIYTNGEKTRIYNLIVQANITNPAIRELHNKNVLELERSLISKN